MAKKQHRRSFSAKYKHDVLIEVDAATEPGEIAALLRREGLSASHLHAWRRAREHAIHTAFEPKKRGPKSMQIKREKIVALERALDKALGRARRAELLVAAQKKIWTALGRSVQRIDASSSRSCTSSRQR